MRSFTCFLLLSLAIRGLANEAAPTPAGTGSVRGTVTLAANGDPLHHAHVVLLPLGKSSETNDAGEYVIDGVPPGTYSVVAHMHALSDVKKTVTLQAGQTGTADFKLRLQPVKESLTVTASGRENSVMETFQSVLSKESYELAAKAPTPALGEVLDGEPGIAKRSFGPGSSRPVIRGFDGDRVLVLQDGVRTGTLSSQSGDHGEPVDVTQVERIEVVRGPASLLYGSNAIGGVVNVISGHHILHQSPHEGLHGSFTSTGGTNNRMGGSSANFEYGKGKWMLHGGGGGLYTGDYRSPLGRVQNSATNMNSADIGIGRFGDKFAWNFTYGWQNGQYGVPFDPDAADHNHDAEARAAAANAEFANRRLAGVSLLAPMSEDGDPSAGDGHDHGAVRLDWRRNNYRFQSAVKQLPGILDEFQLSLNYSDWNHREVDLDTNTIGTNFFNKQFVYRGAFSQRKRGPLTGTFGVWGMHRDFKAVGDEALAPPAKQNSIALFGLEELAYEHIRFQFGARVENNRYSALGLLDRDFTGASASAGVYVPTWRGGAVVANYMRSYRAPSLEELYNHGPHPGNAVFEIGDVNLKRERGDGVELSVRHSARRLRLETNLFRYQMSDFIYFNPTGAFADGLPVAEYKQADARFLGADARVDAGLTNWLWLNLGFDAVDAQLTKSRMNLPRIPPVRGRVGFDWRWKGLSVKPEAVIANKQWQLAPNETLTSGYAVFNLNASYTYTQQHLMHTISANSFNMGDRLYRNHLSFIKQFAPEIGRGIRFSYTVAWF